MVDKLYEDLAADRITDIEMLVRLADTYTVAFKAKAASRKLKGSGLAPSSTRGLALYPTGWATSWTMASQIMDDTKPGGAGGSTNGRVSELNSEEADGGFIHAMDDDLDEAGLDQEGEDPYGDEELLDDDIVVFESSKLPSYRPANNGPPNRVRKACWNCGRLGHFKDKCRVKKRVFGTGQTVNVFTKPKPASRFPKRFDKKRNTNFVKMHKAIGKRVQELGDEAEVDQYLDLDHRAIQQMGRALAQEGAGGTTVEDAGVEKVEEKGNEEAGLVEGPQSGQ